MSNPTKSELEILLKKYALQNAIRYNGTATEKSVLGKALSEQPELRKDIAEVKSRLAEIIDKINNKSLDQQKEELMDLAPELLERKKAVEKEKELPALKNADEKVVMRFAPGPSGPLHIGHARAAILNDEYCKSYDGKLILRLEDTNPAKLMPEAYDMIKEDLDWLGVKYHEVVVQSDRFDTYYKIARELLEKGKAYICTCDVEDWRSKKTSGKSCKHRELEPSEQLEHWQKMLDGSYKEGEATYIVKTDLNHPNPAVRDFIAFRIIESPLHPLKGDNYRVYPLMNFSVAVDDHTLGLTHVLRGKDHLNNTYRQGYMYDYLNWLKPEYIHYGWVSIEGTILKTSEITTKISKGEINDWSDVRLGTFRALGFRGIKPEAIRRYWLEVGVKEVDVKFSWETLYAFNRDIVDSKTPRYFFVPEPIKLNLSGKEELEGCAPLHPGDPSTDFRKVPLKAEGESKISIWIDKADWREVSKLELFRFKDLCNVAPTGEDTVKFDSEAASVIKDKGGKIVQWVSGTDYLRVALVMPDGKVQTGRGELDLKNAVGNLVQFERVGFAMLYLPSSKELTVPKKINVDETDLIAVYAHK